MKLFLALSYVVLLLQSAAAESAGAQANRERFVIDTGVVCHTAPDQRTATTRSLRLASSFFIGRELVVDGTTWYSDDAEVNSSVPSCWVYGPSTADWSFSNPVPAWTAMLEHLLARADVKFEEYVDIDNRLSYPGLIHPRHREMLAASGLLQYRRLQLLDRVLSGPLSQAAVLEPLQTAWMLAHSDLVASDHFGGGLSVKAGAYWALYDRNKEAPWADDLAWIAARRTPSVDECYPECVLQILIIDGPLQYWERLPRGKHVAEAIHVAVDLTKVVADEACFDKDPDHPERPTEYPVPIGLVDQIRKSLAMVTIAEKRDIPQSLDTAERKCASR